MTARVAVMHGTRIDVEAQNGAPLTVVVEASPHVREVALINPWKNTEVQSWSGHRLQTHLKRTLLQVPLSPGNSYMVKPTNASLIGGCCSLRRGCPRGPLYGCLPIGLEAPSP